MGLRQNMLHEPVSRLELREAIVVSPEATVGEAIRKMQAHRLGCVVVAHADGIPLGIFTERNVLQLLVESPALLEEPVGKHLEPHWISINRSDPIAEVVAAMHKQGLRFVCVNDSDGHCVAITGQKGLLEYIAEHFPRHVLTQTPGAKSPDEREGA